MPNQPTNCKTICCLCVFFDLLVPFFGTILCHYIISFRNPWFYVSKTEVSEGVSSCVMEAKKWPRPILAVRRVKTALSCESGVHFREGNQKVFACELHMMVGYTKTHISTTYCFTLIKHMFREPQASFKCL